MATPREKPLRNDRVLYLLILCLAAGCVLWVQVGVLGLKASSETKEENLHHFLALFQRASSTASSDPEEAANHLARVLASWSWESTLGDLEPQIVATPSGPLLRLVKRKEGR